MARIRTIKPEFFTSLTIADLTVEQRLTFIGLWTHCDDEGRCVDDARLIKAAIWPLDDRTAADVERDLGVLTESSLITRYTLNRRRYLVITGWGEHQKINRPSPSKLPAPDDGEILPPTSANESSSNDHGVLSEDSPPERNREQGTGKGTGNESAIAPRSPDAPKAEQIRDDVERLCRHLADRIEGNGARRPTINKTWRDAARLLIDKDGRTERDVHAAIDWATGHEFWRANILSMPKLREQYDQLSLQAQRGRASPGRALAGTDARVGGWLALAAEAEQELR